MKKSPFTCPVCGGETFFDADLFDMFYCPSCNETYDIPPDYRESIFECPECGELMYEKGDAEEFKCFYCGCTKSEKWAMRRGKIKW